MGSTSLSLELLAQLAQAEAEEASLLLKLPLDQAPEPHLVHDAASTAGASVGVADSSKFVPALEVKIQYLRETQYTAPAMPTSVGQDSGSTEAAEGTVGAAEGNTTVKKDQSPYLRGMEAVLSVSILQACGLQVCVHSHRLTLFSLCLGLSSNILLDLRKSLLENGGPCGLPVIPFAGM
jgi:hypothetical protein